MFRKVAVSLIAVTTLLATASAYSQQAYPKQKVTLVTHSSPGAGSDLFLRDLVKFMPPTLKTNFVVENIRGGSGATAVAHVAKGSADGSIFYATTPTYIQTTLLSKPQVGYDALDPIVIVFLDPQVIYTRVDSPFKSLKEVIAHAKANPGKSRWGASNPASVERIAMERLSRAAGVKVPIVSHEGGADQMIGVLNGTFDIGIGEVQELAAQLQAGKVRLLATLTDSRLESFPNLPTAKEQGLDVTVKKFRGLAGPKGIPDDVAKALEDAVRAAVNNPAYKSQYVKESLVPIVKGRKEARAYTEEFVKEISTSLRELGVLK